MPEEAPIAIAPVNISARTILHESTPAGQAQDTVSSPFREVGAQLTQTAREKDMRISGEFLSRISPVHNQVEQIRDQMDAEMDADPEVALEASERHVLYDVMFGYLQMDPQILARVGSAERGLFQHERVESARISHALVHHMFDATYPDADPSFVDAVYQSLFHQRSVLDITARDIPYEFKTMWAGLRNEWALVQTLAEGGYHIFLPNYAQDPTGVDDSQNEVLNLDVVNATDLIAVSPHGTIFLIDIKGAKHSSSVGTPSDLSEEVSEPRLVSLSETETNPVVLEAIKHVHAAASDVLLNVLSATPIVKTQVFVGGQRELEDPFTGAQASTASKQGYIKFIGRLTDNRANSILASLGELDDIVRDNARHAELTLPPTKVALIPKTQRK